MSNIVYDVGDMILDHSIGGRALVIVVGIAALVLVIAGGAGALTVNASGGEAGQLIT
jgi:hypothetical protein